MNYEYPNREKNSHDFRFLRRIGYVGFIERMADSQLALGLQNPVARRLTAIAFIMGAMGIGVVSGLLVHASDQGLSILGYFALLAVAVFFAWLAEVAMAIQVGRAIFKHFDERMEQIYLEAKARRMGCRCCLWRSPCFWRLLFSLRSARWILHFRYISPLRCLCGQWWPQHRILS